MIKQERATQAERTRPQMDLNHLRRETRTALELAVIALAPTELVDRLAAVAGLLEALAELPSNSAPVLALVPTVEPRARAALEDWRKWQHEHLEAKMARG
jgi:hypothetical protein